MLPVRPAVWRSMSQSYGISSLLVVVATTYVNTPGLPINVQQPVQRWHWPERFQRQRTDPRAGIVLVVTGVDRLSKSRTPYSIERP
jgi:hypothetical protein